MFARFFWTGHKFPPSVHHEVTSRRRSEHLTVVLSQKRRFAFYSNDFPGTVLHLADQEDSYFTVRADETARAIIAIAAEVEAKRILLMGCSKGGFGALLMAALCSRADKKREYSSLCFGPQTRIAPFNSQIKFPSYKALLERADSDPKLKKYLAKFGDATYVPPSTRSVIVFGEKNIDDRFEAEAVTGDNVTLIPLPLKTHSVVLPFLVDNSDRDAVTMIVERLIRAAKKETDLNVSMKAQSTVDEILSLPRTKSLAEVCAAAIASKGSISLYA